MTKRDRLIEKILKDKHLSDTEVARLIEMTRWLDARARWVRARGRLPRGEKS